MTKYEYATKEVGNEYSFNAAGGIRLFAVGVRSHWTCAVVRRRPDTSNK